MKKETELILEWRTNDPDIGYNILVEGLIGSYTLGKPANNRLKVRCVDLDEVFDSIESASVEMGINRNSIRDCCKGNNRVAGGYFWEYVDVDLQEKYREKRDAIIKKGLPIRHRKVRCLETGELVESNKVLAERYGILSTSVSNKIRTNQKFKDGTHWEFLGKKKVHRSTQNNRDFVVLCVETGKLFRTVAIAAKVTGTDECGIRYVIKGKNKTAGGYHWKFLPIKDIDLGKVEIGSKIYSMYKRVLCVETGKVYENAIEVEKATGIKADLIHDVCRKKRETTYNYHWEYLD